MAHLPPRFHAARTRSEAGVAFPSPVVILSIIAVVMAGVSFVATRDSGPAEREITTVSQPSAGPSESPSRTGEPEIAEGKKIAKKKPKPIDRSSTYVVVFNNSGITGLAGSYADTAAGLGWQVVGSDNWRGLIPSSTVYYPPGMERAAKQLALDLGISRVSSAVDPMSMDQLTVILTADAA